MDPEVLVTAFEQADGGVQARLRGPEGESTCQAAFLAGCDGAHSVVREALKVGFPGGTYAHTFYVADGPTWRRPVPPSTASCTSPSTRTTSPASFP